MKTDKISINVNGEKYVYDKGTTLLQISKAFSEFHTTPIVAASVNNNIKDMSTPLTEDCSVTFLDLSTEAGFKVYSRSLVFIMTLAARDLFPNGQVIVQHSMSKGLYCEFHLDYPLTEQDVKAVEDRMREIIEEDLPITKKTVSLEEAIALFEAIGMNAKAKLLKQLNRKTVDMYFCGNGYCYLYFTMVPSTGYLKTFELRYYQPGMILRYPLQDEPDRLPPFVEMPKLAKVFLESKRWAEIVECDYISRLNEYVENDEINNVILMAEALHEKKIAEIADYIESNINRFKIILVAGPSSSGKTTFIQRLSIQLKVLGINTIKISLDDYYMDREKMANLRGEVDLESLDTIDVALFNEHLNRMMTGEEIELPHFDFCTGRQVPSGRKAKIDKRKLVIIEGLHALNEKLTVSIPRHNKVKIHISPMTHLAVDEHSRVQTTDTRLIRRIVRDSQFRNHDAVKTLKMWPSVMRGEQKNIFPYTEDADVMFNSALVYEMAVLRNFAIPLLKEIGPEHPEHKEARRLIRYLSFVFPVTDAEIPLNSILREFIGKSCFFK
ncbi:MAG: nucleoside kinase [Anaerovoracaceae bacterium]